MLLIGIQGYLQMQTLSVYHSIHAVSRDDGKRVKVLKVIHDVVAVLIRCYCALRHISKKTTHEFCYTEYLGRVDALISVL